jgi:hypothetical protein
MAIWSAHLPFAVSAVIVRMSLGMAVVLRRMTQLVPIVINGYTPSAAASNPGAPQFAALDDVFARYPL